MAGRVQKQMRRRQGEEQVLGRIAQFAGEVVVIVGKMRDVVERFAAGRYEDLAQAALELDQLESAADDTKEAILDRLAQDTIFPMTRADLARLVASVDAIANLAKGTVDRLCMRKLDLSPRMNVLIVELARIDLEATDMLRNAVLAFSYDLREAIRMARQVDRIESRADDVYGELYKAMFELDTDYRTFHLIKAIIERLERLADRCAENAELLRHTALEYLENE
jgi:predicted phosphate transport protein (TIGR00153 family)